MTTVATETRAAREKIEEALAQACDTAHKRASLFQPEGSLVLDILHRRIPRQAVCESASPIDHCQLILIENPPGSRDRYNPNVLMGRKLTLARPNTDRPLSIGISVQTGRWLRDVKRIGLITEEEILPFRVREEGRGSPDKPFHIVGLELSKLSPNQEELLQQIAEILG